MNPELRLSELKPGMALPGIERVVTQEDVNRYAEASQDFNPIHIDEDFARRSPHGGTIAHGMLILAYVSRMMTAAFGTKWLRSGKLNVRFRAPARPGDNIVISGKIREFVRGQGEDVVICDVLGTIQDGDSVIVGEARVIVPGNRSDH